MPTVEKLCTMASKPLMPASQYAPAQAKVKNAYTYHKALAVSAIRGVSLASFMGPGISVRYSCMPPTPSMGKMATANTIIPIPPNHCSCWRYHKIDLGRLSKPVITVAPVVVQPEKDSKKASRSEER